MEMSCQRRLGKRGSGGTRLFKHHSLQLVSCYTFPCFVPIIKSHTIQVNNKKIYLNMLAYMASSVCEKFRCDRLHLCTGALKFVSFIGRTGGHTHATLIFKHLYVMIICTICIIYTVLTKSQRTCLYLIPIQSFFTFVSPTVSLTLPLLQSNPSYQMFPNLLLT